MLATLLAAAALAAAPFPETIPVPTGSNPEGIAAKGSTFYVGSRANGSVYSGSLRSGEGAILVPAQTGRQAYGLKARGRRLYVAGGPTGFVYVYDARTGANVDAEQLFAPPAPGFINDVTVTHRAAYFTDSLNPVIYVYDRKRGTITTLQLGGEYAHQPGFNANGIAATPNGKRLIIVQSNTGSLYSVNPKTGAAQLIDAPPVTMGDGILLHGKRLYVVRNRANEVVVLRLRERFTEGTRIATLTDPEFDIPTTIARHGSRLYVINARFGQESPTDRVRHRQGRLNGSRHSSHPRCTAQRLSSWRLESCSLRTTAETCASTVLAEMPSRRAISLYR
jgi:sugar lactone lactonase YvrE